MDRTRAAGRGMEVLDDGSSFVCGHDLALVLLEEPIRGVPIAPLRLDSDARAGEALRFVGWGIAGADNKLATQRKQRGGVPLKYVGPHDAYPLVPQNELFFGESICTGDSGGPIYAEETGAILGVVSRGGNGIRDGGIETCTEAENWGTLIRPFRSLIDRGFAQAGAEPVLERRVEEDSGFCLCAIATGLSPRGHRGAALFAAGVLVGALRRRRAGQCYRGRT